VHQASGRLRGRHINPGLFASPRIIAPGNRPGARRLWRGDGDHKPQAAERVGEELPSARAL